MSSRIARLGLLATLAGCATTGSTWQSGVGDRMLEHPPYAAGAGATADARIVRLPVTFQRGASQAPIFDPGSAAGTPVAALVAALDARLDSLAAAAAWATTAARPAGTPPDVYFGCQRDATDDCVERDGDSVLGRQGTTMLLALHRPSPEWIAAAGQAMDSAGATHALLVTLEVGQYWLRQSGLAGRKSVELGRGHTAPIPWLTSLETPVTVLQLTGVLVDRTGRGVRIGAEGIIAVRTPLVASGLGAQRLLTDEDVERARTLRREDLPGQPLAWEAALCALVSDLAARPVCR